MFAFQMGIIALTVDIAILMLTILAIGMGVDVQHISFWDAQLRFVVSLLG